MTHLGSTALKIFLLGLMCWILFEYLHSGQVPLRVLLYLAALLAIALLVGAFSRVLPGSDVPVRIEDATRRRPHVPHDGFMSSRVLTDFLTIVLAVAILGYLAHVWRRDIQLGPPGSPESWPLILAFLTLMILVIFRGAATE